MTGQATTRARAALDLRRYDEAARHAGLAIAAAPEDADGYHLLASALHGLGRDEEALSALDSAIAKAPERSALYVKRSDLLRALDRAHDALGAGREAVRLDARSVGGHTAVALSLAALGDRVEAIVAIRRALALAPNGAALHRILADQQLAIGDSDAAIATYHRALALNANDAFTLNNLGCALLRSKRTEEAACAFKAAMMIDPTMKTAKQNTHLVVRSFRRGASLVGALALLATKLKFVWIAYFATRAFSDPGMWGVIVGLLAAGYTLFVLVRGQLRWRRLRRRDPQLVALYKRLKADKKAGRL